MADEDTKKAPWKIFQHWHWFKDKLLKQPLKEGALKKRRMRLMTQKKDHDNKEPITYQVLRDQQALVTLSQRLEELRGIESGRDAVKQKKYFFIEDDAKPRLLNAYLQLGPYTTMEVLNREKGLATKGTGHKDYLFDMQIPLSETNFTKFANIRLQVPLPEPAKMHFPDGFESEQVRFFGERKMGNWKSTYAQEMEHFKKRAELVYKVIQKDLEDTNNDLGASRTILANIDHQTEKIHVELIGQPVVPQKEEKPEVHSKARFFYREIGINLIEFKDSSPNQENISERRWDFGADSKNDDINGRTVERFYQDSELKNGRVPVTLNIRYKDDPQLHTYTRIITVTGKKESEKTEVKEGINIFSNGSKLIKKIIDENHSRYEIETGEELKFEDITNIPNEKLKEREWTVNGSVINREHKTVSYRFREPGVYTVVLSVNEIMEPAKQGEKDSEVTKRHYHTETIYVTASELDTIDFDINTVKDENNKTRVRCNFKAKKPEGLNITKWEWDLEHRENPFDPDTGYREGNKQDFILNSGQAHEITLRATDNHGKVHVRKKMVMLITHSFKTSDAASKMAERVAFYLNTMNTIIFPDMFTRIIDREIWWRGHLNQKEKQIKKTGKIDELWREMIEEAPDGEVTRFHHTYYVLEPEVYAPDGTLTHALTFEHSHTDKNTTYVHFPKYGREFKPGCDENGMPLEVDPESGEILIDKWRMEFGDKCSPKPSTVRKIPAEFIKEQIFIKRWDPILVANQINAEWDEIRDCIRDGRYFPNVPTIADHIIWTQHNVWKEWEQGEWDEEMKEKISRRDPRFRQVHIGMYFQNPETKVVPKFPGQPRLTRTRGPANLLPAFDLDAIGPHKFMYPGKLYYYDWPAQNGHLSSEPSTTEDHPEQPVVFASSRGISQYIVDTILFREFYDEDIKIAEEIIGDADYGPRFFGREFNEKLFSWAKKADELNKGFKDDEEEFKKGIHREKLMQEIKTATQINGSQHKIPYL